MSRALLSLSLLVPLLLSAAAAHGDDDTSSHGDDDTSSLRARPLILVKIWCLILVFIGTFAGGISPYFLKWNEGFLVIGTQFAGGVFLGTALMHFLSDSNETFGDLTDKEYPFAFMLACTGYLLTMLADCTIAYVFRNRGQNEVQGERGGLSGSGAVQPLPSDSVAGMKCDEKGRVDVITPSQHQANHLSENPFVKAPITAATSLGDSILLIVALCFHSVFEGIAIGVAETKADAWRALWTVCLHKIFAAIAMGIALLRMIPDRPLFSCVAYAFAFAISSPIGVAIGIIIDATTQGRVADWIYAISMGLACGVFIYVSINHLLSKGYVAHKQVLVDTPMYKFLAVVLGVGIIAVVMIWD